MGDTFHLFVTSWFLCFLVLKGDYTYSISARGWKDTILVATNTYFRKLNCPLVCQNALDGACPTILYASHHVHVVSGNRTLLGQKLAGPALSYLSNFRGPPHLMQRDSF
jgi:hypothetical protein